MVVLHGETSCRHGAPLEVGEEFSRLLQQDIHGGEHLVADILGAEGRRMPDSHGGMLMEIRRRASNPDKPDGTEYLELMRTLIGGEALSKPKVVGLYRALSDLSDQFAVEGLVTDRIGRRGVAISATEDTRKDGGGVATSEVVLGLTDGALLAYQETWTIPPLGLS